MDHNPALLNNWDHFVLATDVKRLGDPSPDETEQLQIELQPRSAIRPLIASGQIFHALHVAALFAYLDGGDDPRRV